MTRMSTQLQPQSTPHHLGVAGGAAARAGAERLAPQSPKASDFIEVVVRACSADAAIKPQESDVNKPCLAQA